MNSAVEKKSYYQDSSLMPAEVRGQSNILKTLIDSKERRTIIAISSPALGETTFLTTIVDIGLNEHGDIEVYLIGYDVTGYFYKKDRLALTEIEFVIPFVSIFQNPFLHETVNGRATT